MTKEQLAELYEAAILEVEKLKNQVAWFRRQMFGKKSERHVLTDPSQLILDLGASLAAAEEEKQAEKIKVEYERNKRKDRKEKPVRTDLPAHLPREEHIIEPEGDLTGMVKIKDVVSEWLEEIPGRIFVVREVKPVYGYKNDPDKGLIQAKATVRPLQKFSVGVGMLVLIMIRKYVDHLPVYRQRQIYKRAGLYIPESTMHGWIKAGANMLIPLYERLQFLLLTGVYIQSDDTRFRVLMEKGNRETLLGNFWIYQNPITKIVIFDYRPTREKEGPASVLDTFEGFLQTDGNSTYESVCKGKPIVLLNCWAHARRNFEEAKDNDPKRAAEILLLIQKLYAVERIARENNYSFDERHALRQKESVPALKEIKHWLIKNFSETTPASLMGKAIAYALSRIDNELSAYCKNGMLEIDNNLAENSIRPVVLGRKNFMFAANHESAQRAAMIYSIVITCKQLGINQEAYLNDVLPKLATWPPERFDELLPQNWKPANAA